MYIINIVIKKHHLHLETKLYIEKKLDIGNIRIRLEANLAYLKHHYRLETQTYIGNISQNRDRTLRIR